MMLAAGFLVDALRQVEKVSPTLPFSEGFYHEWVLKPVEHLFCTDGYDPASFFFNLFMWWIIAWIDFQILKHSASLE